MHGQLLVMLFVSVMAHAPGAAADTSHVQDQEPPVLSLDDPMSRYLFEVDHRFTRRPPGADYSRLHEHPGFLDGGRIHPFFHPVEFEELFWKRWTGSLMHTWERAAPGCRDLFRRAAQLAYWRYLEAIGVEVPFRYTQDEFDDVADLERSLREAESELREEEDP